MAYQVPTTLMPDTLVVGDYWQWRVPSQGDYPAASWTLSFAFAGLDTIDASTGWTITAESGGTWLVQVAKANTERMKAGRYRWRAYVTSGAERYQIATGWVALDQNLAAVAGDQRTHAQKTLALVEAALEGRLTTQEESYAIGGRSISKMPITQLRELRGLYAAEVWRELHPGQAMPSTGIEFQRA